MEKAKVYFTDLHTQPGNNLLDKLRKLVKKAGIENIDFKNKFTAIKIHFGEPGNLAYIRPNYAKIIADLVKEKGGIPFLTDASTLYFGKRANAVDHIDSAFQNGFNPLTVGCNVVIADGLIGMDYREVPINAKHCKSPRIASAIAESDIIISMNHFKGHEMTGFGGAIKNIGMGSGSKNGKLEMHSTSKPRIIEDNCKSCGQCFKNCSQKAIHFKDSNKRAVIDYDICIGCGQCVAMCLYNSAVVKWDESADVANEKIAEYCYAVIKDKPNFHINFIMDVSPNCDCWSSNDIPIVPNIGIAASFDPVALDKACADMVNKAPITYNFAIKHKEKHEHDEDKFSMIHPNTNWMSGLSHAASLGVGNINYELITIE